MKAPPDFWGKLLRHPSVRKARAHTDATAEEATMLSVDRLGFRVRLRSGERLHGARIAFPHEVTTPEQCRATLIEMIRNARR